MHFVAPEVDIERKNLKIEKKEFRTCVRGCGGGGYRGITIGRGRQREMQRIAALELSFKFDAEFHLVIEEFGIL